MKKNEIINRERERERKRGKGAVFYVFYLSYKAIDYD